MNSPLMPIRDSADYDVRCCSLSRWLPYAAILLLAVGVAALLASQLIADDDVATRNATAVKGAVVVDDQPTEEKQSETPDQEYVRIRKNERKLAVALETSVIHFADSKRYPDATVDLIGAIHLGEPDYYQQLNTLFEKYDVLLFEAVMPEEAVKRDLRPGSGDGSRRKGLNDEVEWTEAKVGLAAISVLQLGMKDALGMEFQLTGVDYSAENFVHADMTAEEFEESMTKRGESFSGMFLKEMGKSVANQQDRNPLAMNLDMMLSMLTSDRLYRVRRIAAVQLAKAGEGDAFVGFDGSSTIITERNKKCFEVMVRELKKGKKKVGIFYGAGHFADMEKRMVAEHEFTRKSEDWLVAWHLRNPEENAKSDPAVSK